MTAESGAAFFFPAFVESEVDFEPRTAGVDATGAVGAGRAESFAGFTDAAGVDLASPPHAAAMHSPPNTRIELFEIGIVPAWIAMDAPCPRRP